MASKYVRFGEINGATVNRIDQLVFSRWSMVEVCAQELKLRQVRVNLNGVAEPLYVVRFRKSLPKCLMFLDQEAPIEEQSVAWRVSHP